MAHSDHLKQETVLEVLKGVRFPNLSRDIVSFGLVKGISISDGNVTIDIKVSSRDRNVPITIENDVVRAIRLLPGVKDVHVNMSWTQPDTPPPQPHHPPQAQTEEAPLLPNVKTRLAVASGKGGVGKSTVAAGLALMAQKKGLRVGLVDFDIYGPSVPMIMGVHEKPRVHEGKLIPLDRRGLKLMSMGFLVDPATPMIWRGPMVHQATEQFLRDVDWGELDMLIVDLPPGTGDAQMTLSQKVNLDGAVIVSTPQDLALIDARKGAAMFAKLEVPILGIVENMSGFTCAHCGKTTYIFGKDGAAREAKELGVPLLGRLPLVPKLVEAADGGDLLSAIESDATLASIFRDMADRILQAVELIPQK